MTNLLWHSVASRTNFNVSFLVFFLGETSFALNSHCWNSCKFVAIPPLLFLSRTFEILLLNWECQLVRVETILTTISVMVDAACHLRQLLRVDSLVVRMIRRFLKTTFRLHHCPLAVTTNTKVITKDPRLRGVVLVSIGGSKWCTIDASVADAIGRSNIWPH